MNLHTAEPEPLIKTITMEKSRFLLLAAFAISLSSVGYCMEDDAAAAEDYRFWTQKQYFDAVERGSLKSVEALGKVRDREFMLGANETGRTALMIACRQCHEFILIERHHGVEFIQRQVLAMVEELLRHSWGANDYLCAQSESGFSALYHLSKNMEGRNAKRIAQQMAVFLDTITDFEKQRKAIIGNRLALRAGIAINDLNVLEIAHKFQPGTPIENILIQWLIYIKDDGNLTATDEKDIARLGIDLEVHRKRVKEERIALEFKLIKNPLYTISGV
jgi:hypothetical protein